MFVYMREWRTKGGSTIRTSGILLVNLNQAVLWVCQESGIKKDSHYTTSENTEVFWGQRKAQSKVHKRTGTLTHQDQDSHQRCSSAVTETGYGG
jgi:hypothetical protein